VPIRNLLPLAVVREELAELETKKPCTGRHIKTYQERHDRLQTMLRHHLGKRKGTYERNRRYEKRHKEDPAHREDFLRRKAFNQQVYLVRKPLLEELKELDRIEKEEHGLSRPQEARYYEIERQLEALKDV
jgi:hypothetical protein